jgi:Holliday junction resolvasome RuvABC endonuclease subunit
MIYIGIDPGVGGGLAAIDSTSAVHSAIAMPETERDVLDWISRWNATPALAVLERVRSSPQMGVVSAFTFGRGYGALRMALTAARIPFDEVLPRTWQTLLFCLTKGDKNVTKLRAQALFPSQQITHATADALLLAAYCRRIDHRPEERQHGKAQGRRKK